MFQVHVPRAGLGLAFAGGIAFAGGLTPTALGHHATPAVARPGHPVHIHGGTCAELGDVVVPLNDLAAPAGDRLAGPQRRRYPDHGVLLPSIGRGA